MKKFLIILVPFILYASPSAGQHTFQKHFQKQNDQQANHVIELEEGGFLIVGLSRDYVQQTTEGYVIRLGADGTILDEKLFQQGDGTFRFFDVFQSASGFNLLGGYSTDSEPIGGLLYMELDHELDLFEHKVSPLIDGRVIGHMRSLVDDNGDFVVAGYTSRNRAYEEVLATGPNNDPFVYKLNENGDSLASVFLSTNSPLQSAYGVAQSSDKEKYYVFATHITIIGAGVIVYSLGLDSLDYIVVPTPVRDYYSPIWLNDSTILICGKGTHPYQYKLNATSLTENFEEIDFNSFYLNDSYREHPARFRGVDINGTNIYLAGTTNFDYGNPFYSNNKSWYHLVKVNPDLTPVWEYWYGGDAYYFLYGIAATSDGGCIMVGNRYDYTTQSPNRDIFVVKVDVNGLVVGQNEFKEPYYSEAILTPNPGSSFAKANIGVQHSQADLYLYDLSGKQVLEAKKLTNGDHINMSALDNGVYVYHIVSNGKEIGTGKWVKGQ